MTYKEFKENVEDLGLKVFTLNIIVCVNNDKYNPIYYLSLIHISEPTRPY